MEDTILMYSHLENFQRKRTIETQSHTCHKAFFFFFGYGVDYYDYFHNSEQTLGSLEKAVGMAQADEMNNAPFIAHKGMLVSRANQNGDGYKCHPTVLLEVIRTN